MPFSQMTNTLAELSKNVQEIAKEYSLEEYPIAIVISPKWSARPMPANQMTNTLAELGNNVQKVAKEYSLEEYPIAIVIHPNALPTQCLPTK
jgi:hypothetical protein